MSSLILPNHLTPTERAEIFAHTTVAAIRRAAADAAVGAPRSFDYQTVLVGVAGDATVYYDPQLGAEGLTLAQAVLAGVPSIDAADNAYFAPKITAKKVNVIIAALGGRTDGTAGAYHYGCDFKSGADIYVDAALGNPTLTLGLYEAERSECSMGRQSKGWKCGWSNGEALSRVLAELQSGGPEGALAAYASGPSWAEAGMPNWIDATAPTDQDYPSIGCGVVFLYWLISLGHSAAKVAQAGCPKTKLLNACYAVLTGKPAMQAWPDFKAAVAALAAPIAGDNPFGGTPA